MTKMPATVSSVAQILQLQKPALKFLSQWSQFHLLLSPCAMQVATNNHNTTQRGKRVSLRGTGEQEGKMFGAMGIALALYTHKRGTSGLLGGQVQIIFIISITITIVQTGMHV